MALWYYGWEFTQTDPTFPSYVLSSVQWIHPSLSRFIPENKLLASVPCFQKIRLLFTNDLYFLTITCRPSRSFFLFTFLFYFYIHSLQLYTCGPLWGKPSLYIYILIHDKTFSVHALELFLFTSHSLYTNPIYVQRFFRFSQHTPVVHTKVSLYTLVAHTHENFFPRITYTHKNPSIHIFLLHTYKKTLFFSLYT